MFHLGRALLFAAPCLSTAAQQPLPSTAELAPFEGREEVRIGVLPEGTPPPILDGSPTETVWDLAEELGALRQVIPVAGAEPSERTVVKLLRDDRRIYVALFCYDSDPSAIRATQKVRDANLDPDDRVEMLFDPFLDRRNAFWFQIGAGGSIGDALITRNGSDFNKRWDGLWTGRSTITDEGWFAEISIPVQTLKFDPGADRWGFNLRRLIRRRTEEARWASPEPRLRFFSIADAGDLNGVAGMQQGLGLDVRPFFVLDATHDRSLPSGDRDDFEFDAGLDLFYSITSRSKLSVSINTDFAETEVDDRQVNLTRFPLFFPERRDFFLEDSGVFVFADDNAVVPFFSRRIGLDSANREVPLIAAAKFTAQTDEFSVGVLNVQTDDVSDLDQQNLSVGRFSANIFEQSDIGVIWTHGDPTSERRADTYGLDLNLRTNEFLGDRNLRFNAYAVRSDNEAAVGSDDGNDTAYAASLEYPNDEISANLSWTTVEERFDPSLGFVRRPGSKTYEAGFSYRPRQYTHVRRYVFEVEPLLVTNSANETQTVEIEAVPLGIEWESGDEFYVIANHRREVLNEDFAIADDVTIPAGSYSFSSASLFALASDRRPLAGSLELGFGDFFDGTRANFEANLDLRRFDPLVLSLEYEFDAIDLQAGSFDVHTARTRVDFQFTPELTWSNFLQYDNVSDALGWNARLWWIPQPGRELFLVANQGWEASGGNFDPTASQYTFKMGTTLRF